MRRLCLGGEKEKRVTAERVSGCKVGEKIIIQCGLSLKISCTFFFSSNGQFKWYTGEGLNRTLTLESTMY